MIDFEASSSASVLEALNEPESRALLFKFALWFIGSEADAEDLLADAVFAMCDPRDGRPWDPTRCTFLAHARTVIRELAKRGRRSARARREVLEDGLAVDDWAVDPHEPPDEALSDAREHARDRRLSGILRRHLGPIPLRVFELRCQGQNDGAELARLCGCSVEKVYDANQTIAYQAGRILAEERQAEAQRMKALQARAKKKSRWVPWRPREEET